MAGVASVAEACVLLQQQDIADQAGRTVVARVAEACVLLPQQEGLLHRRCMAVRAIGLLGDDADVELLWVLGSRR
ncbi:MAG: hypothetical protein ABIZ80_25510 [Bryobacteraceae bacterium]